MKSFGLAIALVCLCGSVAFGASPKDDYLSFWEKVKEGKFQEAAQSLFPIEDKGFLQKQQEFLKINATMLQKGTLKVDVLDSKIQNKWAFLVVRISADQGSKTSNSIQYEVMALDGENWKYVFKQKSGDPSLSTYLKDDFIVLEQWWQANREKYEKTK